MAYAQRPFKRGNLNLTAATRLAKWLFRRAEVALSHQGVIPLVWRPWGRSPRQASLMEASCSKPISQQS
eukprot:5915034-Pyramimonas_sp.AAC.1